MKPVNRGKVAAPSIRNWNIMTIGNTKQTSAAAPKPTYFDHNFVEATKVPPGNMQSAFFVVYLNDINLKNHPHLKLKI